METTREIERIVKGMGECLLYYNTGQKSRFAQKFQEMNMDLIMLLATLQEEEAQVWTVAA
jgi:hypothetical protein